MPTQKATVLTHKQGDHRLDRSFPIPQPGKDEVLVKVKAVAVNFVDYWIKTLGTMLKEYPGTTGCDIAGDVVKVADGVTKFKVGDRIFFAGDFDNQHAGFQEYTLADVHTAAIIPTSLSYDEASTLSIAVGTAYLGLYQDVPRGLGLKSFLRPGGRNAYTGQAIFISGASGSCGQAIVQLAKLSGFTYIVATASPHNADLLKSLGATHVVDRNVSPEGLLAELQKIEGLPQIKYAYDAYADPGTSLRLADTALAPGGYVVTILPHIRYEMNDGKTLCQFNGAKNLDATTYGHYVDLFKHIGKLAESGDIKPQKYEIVPGGLNGVEDAVGKVGAGVSGVKLVIRPEETE